MVAGGSEGSPSRSLSTETDPRADVPEAPGVEPSKRPGIICIVGHHKSGGTPLGAILGNHPDIYYGGEMYRFPSLMWEPGDPNRLCSCGAVALVCPFWSHVRAQSEVAGLLTPLRKGQRRFERLASLPRTVRRARRRDSEIVRHAERMEAFAGLIAAEASAQTIVDQSPNALRASLYRLLEPEGIRVHYVHLIRDGRGFLYSELTAKVGRVPRWERLPFVIVARWVGMNVLTMLLCGQDRSRYLRVRYEDLVANPGPTLRRLGEFLGVDLSETIAKLEAGEAIPMRHVAAANRARLDGTIRLRADTRWQTSLSRRFRALFWLLAGWLARSYGYRRREASPG